MNRPGRALVARSMVLLVPVVDLILGCGRSPIVGADGDAARACLFVDGFEHGGGAWDLDARWSVVVDGGVGGSASLRGWWQDFSVGCPVTAAARLGFSPDTAEIDATTLTFQHRGAACNRDTLRVLASPDGGVTWEVASEPATDRDSWQRAAVDLTPWLDRDDLRFAFEFDNVCGDPCGVDWRIDDVRLCADD